MTDEKIQEKYLLFQLMQQSLESLRQQQEMVKSQMMELLVTENALNEIKGLEEKDDILIPFGSGVFGNGRISDNRKVIVNIGSGVMVRKDLEGAHEFIGKRRDDLEKAGSEISGEMERVAVQINNLGSEIQEMTKEKQ